jgi:hypothetical protein
VSASEFSLGEVVTTQGSIVVRPGLDCFVRSGDRPKVPEAGTRESDAPGGFVGVEKHIGGVIVIEKDKI